MEVKIIIRQFWILIILAFFGLLDYFENGSIISLICSISTFIFLFFLYRSKNNYARILGFFLILISTFGIIDILFFRSEIDVISLITIIFYLNFGILLILNRIEQIIFNIRSKWYYYTPLTLALISYIYYAFLSKKDIDILEIIILIVALVFGILVIIPEKKIN